MTDEDGGRLAWDCAPLLGMTLFRPLRQEALWQAGRLVGGGAAVLWPTGALLRLEVVRSGLNLMEPGDVCASVPVEAEAVALARLIPYRPGRSGDASAMVLQEPGRRHQVGFLSPLDACLHWAIRATAETLTAAREGVLQALREAMGLEEGGGEEGPLEALVEASLVKARAEYLKTGFTAPQCAAVEVYLSQEGRSGEAVPAANPAHLHLTKEAFRGHLACHRRYERRVCALQSRLLAALLLGGPFRGAAQGLEAMAEAWEASLSGLEDRVSPWPAELEGRLHGAALVAARKGCQEAISARVRRLEAPEDAALGAMLALVARLISPGVRSTPANSWPQDWTGLGLDDPASRASAELLYERNRDPQADGFDLFEPLAAARDHFYRGLRLDAPEAMGGRNE